MKSVKQLKAQVGKAVLDPTLASHYQKHCWLSVYVTKQAGKEGSHPEQWRDKRRTRCKGGLDVLRMPWDSLPVRERETRHLCSQTSTAADGETSAANPAGGSRHALTSLAGQPVMVTSGCPRWLGERTAKQSGRSFPALQSYSHSLSSECRTQKGKYTLYFLSGNAVFVLPKHFSGTLESYTSVYQPLAKSVWTSKFPGDFQGK